ncbi:MAG: hypothetical protein EZS28_052245, partial [Streblomastix strix]
MNQPVPPNQDASKAIIHSGAGILKNLGVHNQLQSISNAIPHIPEEDLEQKQLKKIQIQLVNSYQKKKFQRLTKELTLAQDQNLTKKEQKTKVGDNDPASDAETARLAVQGQRAIVAAESSLGLEDPEVTI